MPRTKKGYQWCCSNPKCLAERDAWGDTEGDLVHCSTKNCHGVVWVEKGQQCTSCGAWYCMSCWQSTGENDDADEWHCDKHNQ